ncbi:hypothetical protein Cgig2_019690 [Carnegiea gigantea]|uniref:Magnesium transporter n=1 Tax=Carnegiea gigantea TaxID=171969 RepID=A0A9Q1K0Y4_9CARY|nr:hypothetical protein Cgig2_019690 [Carnegiea gigantea]
MGKNPFSFRQMILRRRSSKKPPAQETSSIEVFPTPNNAPLASGGSGSGSVATGGASSSKAKKKMGGARLWMKFDKFGQSELIELDKGTIIKRVGIPARDLRILGPVFSHSSNIVARERAMVVNLEFIKAIVTAEEVLLLDPLRQEVLPFVDQIRQQLTCRDPAMMSKASPADVQDDEMHSSVARWPHASETIEGGQRELPFEFQVLEIALEVVCSYLDSNVAELEKDAYPVLDELAQNVSTKNLERVRSLKSNLTRLLARVQKRRRHMHRQQEEVDGGDDDGGLPLKDTKLEMEKH